MNNIIRKINEIIEKLEELERQDERLENNIRLRTKFYIDKLELYKRLIQLEETVLNMKLDMQTTEADVDIETVIHKTFITINKIIGNTERLIENYDVVLTGKTLTDVETQYLESSFEDTKLPIFGKGGRL